MIFLLEALVINMNGFIYLAMKQLSLEHYMNIFLRSFIGAWI
jgi:hypothetical protein